MVAAKNIATASLANGVHTRVIIYTAVVRFMTHNLSEVLFLKLLR